MNHCSECCEDPHRGQFPKVTSSISCVECPLIVKWSSPDFGHDTQYYYALEGVHRDVACVMCHHKSTDIDGMKITICRNTPDECSNCHGMD